MLTDSNGFSLWLRFNENVSLVNTMTDTAMDRAGVKEKFGVSAGQIVDFLALTGDTSDNDAAAGSAGIEAAGFTAEI